MFWNLIVPNVLFSSVPTWVDLVGCWGFSCNNCLRSSSQLQLYGNLCVWTTALDLLLTFNFMEICVWLIWNGFLLDVGFLEFMNWLGSLSFFLTWIWSEAELLVLGITALDLLRLKFIEICVCERACFNLEWILLDVGFIWFMNWM